VGVGISVKTLPSGCFRLVTLGVPVPSACPCHPQRCRLLQICGFGRCHGWFHSSSWLRRGSRGRCIPHQAQREAVLALNLRCSEDRNWERELGQSTLGPDHTQPYAYAGKVGTLWLDLLVLGPIAAGAAWKRQGGFISGGECLSEQGLALLELRDTGRTPSRHACWTSQSLLFRALQALALFCKGFRSRPEIAKVKQEMQQPDHTWIVSGKLFSPVYPLCVSTGQCECRKPSDFLPRSSLRSERWREARCVERPREGLRHLLCLWIRDVLGVGSRVLAWGFLAAIPGCGSSSRPCG